MNIVITISDVIKLAVIGLSILILVGLAIFCKVADMRENKKKNKQNR